MKIALTYSKIIPFTVLLITISSINHWSKLPIGNTYVWWAVYATILFTFLKAKPIYFNLNNKKNIQSILILLTWNIICIFRGFFVAENYWEWKNLVGTSMVLLLPLSIYITTNKVLLQKIFSAWIKYALPSFFFFVIFFTHPNASGRYLTPISFLLLFFSVIKLKWRLIILFFCLFVFIGNLDARSNVIKFTVSFLLSFIYYLRLFPINNILRIARLTFLILPFLLFTLGVTGVFNIFKMDEYIEGNYTTNTIREGKSVESSLMADTRTGIYSQVLNSSVKYGYIVLGRSPARGNESETFGLYALEVLKTGKMERFSNEVSILNVFTWTGIIGVVLYFFVFFKASQLAIYYSNNIFIKIIGLNVVFRWDYAWVEDFSKFDLSIFMLWVMIGMCFSKEFRGMTNQEMKYWVLGIFDRKYTRPLHNSRPTLSTQAEYSENSSQNTHLS
ncbi:hypothetical protein [Spirosoma fluviale]|uniref:O-Antigen ligase n=1 Tax=Spirosoma fluviale TaxID=1597977 RepID=A0A286GTK3_9BACT|nr:hypothetical protein [Spirosoma fluviale]SOD98314.1 hypothetical protein SAMN06269250_6021 [Spirosoma fluviale]